MNALRVTCGAAAARFFPQQRGLRSRSRLLSTVEGPWSTVDLIIDTDCGYDDAVAIMLALKAESRGEAKVSAFTTVFGNVSCDQVITNHT